MGKFPIPTLHGKPFKEGQRIKNPDGTPKTVNGYAVYKVAEYRGWDIIRHWGGFVGSGRIDGGAVVETMAYPSREKVKKAIDAWRAQHPDT